MLIPDFEKIPPSHPNPYGFPLSISRDKKRGCGYLPEDTTLYAIGWLGDHVDSTGETPDACIEKLFQAYESELVFSDGTMGWHDCEICPQKEQSDQGEDVGPVVHWQGRELSLYGHGHHLVRLDKTVYMCPALILHYIIAHNYRPPDEFVKAVIEGRFLAPDDLEFVEGDDVPT